MPSKIPSITLGAAVYTVAALFTGFVTIQGGTSAQYVTTLLCCVSALLGPAVAVWHYTTTHKLTLAAGPGAGLGAAAVVAGGLISYVITLGLQALGFYPSNAEMIDRQRDQLLAQGLEPDQVEGALQMAEMFSGPLGVVVNVIVAAVIGAIGGAIAAAIFKRGPVDG
ncbi:hypothetical protein [Rubrivirga sp.]|uniref:hypothetical protein n=1 Tax=Rubrivirga sp. TaxID=1885344 RepID=UPI003C74DDB8